MYLLIVTLILGPLSYRLIQITHYIFATLYTRLDINCSIGFLDNIMFAVRPSQCKCQTKRIITLLEACVVTWGTKWQPSSTRGCAHCYYWCNLHHSQDISWKSSMSAIWLSIRRTTLCFIQEPVCTKKSCTVSTLVFTLGMHDITVVIVVVMFNSVLLRHLFLSNTVTIYCS